jgi:hypothetical protein
MLDADKVDKSDRSGVFEALDVLPDDIQVLLSLPDRLFPSAFPRLDRFDSFTAGERCDYVRLVAW